MRYLHLTRAKKINGAWSPYYVYIDGHNCGTVDNGKTISIPIDYNQHIIRVCASLGTGDYWSDDYVIKQGNCDCNCHVFQKINLLSVDVYIVSV